MPKLTYGFVKPETIAHRTLIYGAPAAGKTTIAVSANASEQWGPVLVVNIDEGLSSVSHVQNLREVKIHSYTEFNQLMTDLTLPVAQKPELLRPVRTVVFDSLSAMRDELLVEFTGIQADKKRREDAWSPEWKDYGKMSAFISDKLNELRSMGIHVIVLAGESPVVPGEMVKPNLNAKLLDYINYGLSHIWYAERDPKSGRYRIQVGPKKNFVLTKNRNPIYTAALKSLTRQQAESRKEDPVAQENWYYIPDYNHPTLEILYNLYLTSGAESAEVVA